LQTPEHRSDTKLYHTPLTLRLSLAMPAVGGAGHMVHQIAAQHGVVH